jgi:hypothetical protein
MKDKGNSGERRRRLQLPRARWVAFAAIVLVVAGAGAAYAAFPQTDVTSYAACLNTAGSAGGQISQVAAGDTPLKPCGTNQKVIHLSGGDITEVKVQGGLTGGGDNGTVTVGLDAAHSLPQSCDTGAVPKADDQGAWACGKDNDTTYSAGRGLTLSGTTFAMDDPQVVSKTDKVDCSAEPDACKRGVGLYGGAVGCPSGSSLLSGGAMAYTGTEPVLGSTPDFVLTATAPAFDDAGRPSGWFGFATFTRDVTSGKYAVLLSAVCTKS